MRVALACDWFLKYAAAQAAGLSRAGAEVLLLCRDHAGEFGGDEDERQGALRGARDAGVSVIEAPGRLWDPAAIPVLLRRRREITRWRPQIVHVHDRVDPRAIALFPRTPASRGPRKAACRSPSSPPNSPAWSRHTSSTSAPARASPAAWAAAYFRNQSHASATRM